MPQSLILTEPRTKFQLAYLLRLVCKPWEVHVNAYPEAAPKSRLPFLVPAPIKVRCHGASARLLILTLWPRLEKSDCAPKGSFKHCWSGPHCPTPFPR